MSADPDDRSHSCPELEARRADPDDPAAVWAIEWLTWADVGVLAHKPGWYVLTKNAQVPICRCPFCGLTLPAPAARRGLPPASGPLGARVAGRPERETSPA